jgi:hypothetical protein
MNLCALYYNMPLMWRREVAVRCDACIVEFRQISVSILKYAALRSTIATSENNLHSVAENKEDDLMLTDAFQDDVSALSDAEPHQVHTCEDGEGRSEVARLRRLIALEYETAERGLTDFAQGFARHAFPNARMSRVSEYGAPLAAMVGESEAMRVVYELYSEEQE